jgi:hypothetical protein
VRAQPRGSCDREKQLPESDKAVSHARNRHVVCREVATMLEDSDVVDGVVEMQLSCSVRDGRLCRRRWRV